MSDILRIWSSFVCEHTDVIKIGLIFLSRASENLHILSFSGKMHAFLVWRFLAYCHRFRDIKWFIVWVNVQQGMLWEKNIGKWQYLNAIWFLFWKYGSWWTKKVNNFGEERLITKDMKVPSSLKFAIIKFNLWTNK